jgi:hypothetical protein
MGTPDPVWCELQDAAALNEPRFDQVYGRCPICRCGATRVDGWCGVWWCRCQLCGTRWPSRVQHFHQAVLHEDFLPLDNAEVDAILFALAVDLAACEWVPVSDTEGDSMLKRSPSEPVLCDPWAGQLPATRGANNPDDAEAAPAGWFALTAPSRARLGLVLIEPEADGLGPWRRLRARHSRGADIGETGAVADAMRRYYVVDDEERARWKTLEAELCDRSRFASPTMLVDLASRKLRVKGDVLTTLRARRAALDAMLNMLEPQLGVSR